MENVLGSSCRAIGAKKICYSCRSNSIYVEGKEVKTFGILASCSDKVVDYITDVNSNFKIVSQLCEKMNAYEVSIEHFRDVVYDFVVSLYL